MVWCPRRLLSTRKRLQKAVRASQAALTTSVTVIRLTWKLPAVVAGWCIGEISDTMDKPNCLKSISGMGARRWILIGVVVAPSLFGALADADTSPTLRTTQISVGEPAPAEILVKIEKPVPQGAIIRVKASGVVMVRRMPVMSIQLMPEGTEQELIHRFSAQEMAKGDWGWHIATLPMAMFKTSRALKPGDVVRILLQTDRTAEEGSPSIRLSDTSGLGWTLFLGVVNQPRDVDLEQVSESVELFFTPGPLDRLEAFLKTDGRLMIEGFDAEGNPTGLSGEELEIAARQKGDSTETTSAVKTVKTKGNRNGTKATVLQLKDAPKAMGRFEVTDSSGRVTLSNAAPFALDGTPIYFGEFHWHTDLSGDGQRRLEDAMASARDELCLDFAGPSEHLGIAGAHYTRNRPEEYIARICKAVEVPGKFTTIAGAELNTRYGHSNAYAEDFDTFAQFMSRLPTELAPQANPNRYPHEPLRAIMPEGKMLYAPHHSNMDSSPAVSAADGRPLWCAMPLPQPADRTFMRLFEMCQVRGTFESEATDEKWGVSHGGLGGSAQTALMKGYRIGFYAGSDNHQGWPTRGGKGCVGVTGVMAASLDQKSIFQALYNRRCYASSGARIVADATLNGAPIGSELNLKPGAERVFKIRICGAAPLEAVQIVSFGCVLAELPVDGKSLDFEAEWRDERPGRPLEDYYYYVRARQADGHRVWLSPWWVDLDDTASAK